MKSSISRGIAPLAAGFLLLTAVTNTIQAAVVVNVFETGGDVVFSASGTLDVSNLTSQGSLNLLAGIDFGAEFLLGADPNGFPAVDYYGAIGEVSPPAALFGVDEFFRPQLGTGPRLGILDNPDDQADPAVVVPAGYVSGTALSSTSTFSGQTFASLGLIPGSYVWTWSGDSVTLNIVPVPAAVWLFASALGVLGWLRRKAT